MRVAVAKRPVQPFDTTVTLPQLQLEPDDEVYFGQSDPGSLVDADGNPVAGPDAGPAIPGEPGSSEGSERLDQDFIDRAIKPREGGQDSPAPNR
jgi:penicillin-binding protein 1A